MRKRWWIGLTVMAAAAICLPIGAAWAPGPLEDPGTVAVASPGGSPSPFTLEVQLAERELQDPALNELSGLAASRIHPGVLYGVNDSGGAAVVYAIDRSGRTVGRLTLDGAVNHDWEAIAPATAADGAPILWIGDIGGNTKERDEVQVLRIAEPAQLGDQRVAWQSFTLRYPDGPNDSEALLVSPHDGSISIVSKGKGTDGRLYTPRWPLDPKRDNTLQPGMATPASVTDGGWELSPAGEPRLVLIDYWRIHRATADGWTSQIGPLMLQREAMAWPWLPDGQPNDGVMLGSEGAGSSIIVGSAP